MKIEREIEMTFDYNTLKRAARDGLRLGNWNGKAVFAASSARLDNLGTGAYYILYDDDNKIVAKTSNGWKSYGEVSESGSVSEYSSARNYRAVEANTSYGRKIPKETPPVTVSYSAEPVNAGGTYSPGYDRTERPVGDVKLEIDVDKVLKTARTMTVESLLEGFLPGVDFSVAKG